MTDLAELTRAIASAQREEDAALAAYETAKKASYQATGRLFELRAELRKAIDAMIDAVAREDV